ncbi:hypothetical protein V6N13_028562 [Hibiscus sabdariffa]
MIHSVAIRQKSTPRRASLSSKTQVDQYPPFLLSLMKPSSPLDPDHRDKLVNVLRFAITVFVCQGEKKYYRSSNATIRCSLPQSSTSTRFLNIKSTRLQLVVTACTVNHTWFGCKEAIKSGLTEPSYHAETR